MCACRLVLRDMSPHLYTMHIADFEVIVQLVAGGDGRAE